MRAGLERWLMARWYGGVAPGPGLRLLAALFGLLVRGRRCAYRRGWLRRTRLPLPVLVVGNLGVGGAGKTPTTIALVDGLRARGWRPGVISRGHGGSEQGPIRLPADPDPARFGDEPCLIALRTGAPVAIGRRRAEAGRLLAASGEVDLLVADDGLQHYALERDLELLVIDGRRRHGNGALLPAGPLREAPARAAGCDLRIVNGGVPEAGEWPLQQQLGDPLPLAGGPALALTDLHGQAVQAVAGIAEPERFFAVLRSAGLQPEPRPFPDHHRFTAADFGFDDGRPLLMTEKDAVKCRAFARPHWYAVPLRSTLPDALFDLLDARLTTLVRHATTETPA
jgi:tetraacyldisaccharide 4'-kinase